MKFLSISITTIFVYMFYTAAYADDPTANKNTLTISVFTLASETDVRWQVKDTMHTRILENRMQQIKVMIPDLRISDNPSTPSILGYRGLGLRSSDANALMIANTFSGQMMALPSAFSSMLYNINDYNSEMEHLIAKIGAIEYPSVSDNGEISFSSLLPAGFNRTITKYGILILEDLPTDTFNIDFSLLNEQCSYIPDRAKRPIYKDIQITRAIEISSSKNAFRINAPEGIATLEKEPSIGSSNFYPTSPTIDSLLIKTIPRLDTLSGTSKNITFQKFAIFSPDVHQYCYLIRTTDLGIAYLRPVSMFIGGIDRLIFFWIYSSDNTFDKETLKKAANQITAAHPVLKINFSKGRQINRYTDLSGRIISGNMTFNKASIQQGVIQKKGPIDRRLIINLK